MKRHAFWLSSLLLVASARGVYAQAVGADPHAGLDGAPALDRKPLTSAEASGAVPAGSIWVRVFDERERPVPGQAVEVGIMASDGARSRVTGTTDSEGHCAFDKLTIGDRQAYRVNVLHQGAKYSATPFRLAADRGYAVVIRRLPTTRDARSVVLYVGATSVELRDERLKIVQQARLYNAASQTYVFPEGGLVLKLPPGAMAFQADEVMSDQRLVADGAGGFKLSGSIAPGEVTLTWGFDLPREGSTADIAFTLPWPTFAYRVLADAAPGMSLEVDGMPAPSLESDSGRKFWLTEIAKRPGDAPLREVRIHVRGIPGPGALRWVATALGLLVVGFGVFIARRPARVQLGTNAGAAFDARQAALLQRVGDLDAERARGDIGEQFHAEQVASVEESLAALLYERERAGRPSAR
jgi:hypothetical protein